MNRQGNDISTQYRSAVFYHSPDQKATAERVIREIAGVKMWDDPIVTAVAPEAAFYAAEDYHQDGLQQEPVGGVLPRRDCAEGLQVPKGVPREAQAVISSGPSQRTRALGFIAHRDSGRGWSTATPFPGNPVPSRYSPGPTGAEPRRA